MHRQITVLAAFTFLATSLFATQASAQRFIPQTFEPNSYGSMQGNVTPSQAHGQIAKPRDTRDRYSTIYDRGSMARTRGGINVHQDYRGTGRVDPGPNSTWRWVNNPVTPGVRHNSGVNWNRNYQLSPQQMQQIQQGVQDFTSAMRNLRQQRQQRQTRQFRGGFRRR